MSSGDPYLDWNRLRGKLGQIEQKKKKIKANKKDSPIDKIKRVDKELNEQSSAMEEKRKEIFQLINSRDKNSKDEALNLNNNDLKNLRMKCEELNTSFAESVTAYVSQLKVEEEKRKVEARKKKERENEIKACGLCGKTKKLTRTECCDRLICDDEDQYVLMSYATNSCYRNHHRYTICHDHYSAGHPGKWQDCHPCSHVEEVLYIWRATNNYNYEKLDIPKVLIKCCNCKFKSYEMEDFSYAVVKGDMPKVWYCKKKECAAIGAFPVRGPGEPMAYVMKI